MAKGNIINKLEPETISGKDGKIWKKQNFIINTGAQYNSEICFQLFGEDKIDMLNHHDEGSKVEVSFNLSSREYNGRYFHNIDAWKISNGNEEGNSETTSEENLPF